MGITTGKDQPQKASTDRFYAVIRLSKPGTGSHPGLSRNILDKTGGKYGEVLKELTR